MRGPLIRIVLACLTLTACSGTRDTFIIADDHGAVASADLKLCGDSRPLRAYAGGWRTSRPITCEGSGTIAVRLKSGQETECIVGYVTPGAMQTFRFEIRDGRCQVKPRQ